VNISADDLQWREEMRREITRIESKIDDALEILKDIRGAVGPRDDLIKEIPFDEAYELAREFIQDHDMVDPLELAVELSISYGQAHDVMLKLRDDGLIELDR
jgi:hypothetical protein